MKLFNVYVTQPVTSVITVEAASVSEARLLAFKSDNWDKWEEVSRGRVTGETVEAIEPDFSTWEFELGS